MLKTTRNQASMKYLWKGEFMAEQKNLITIVQKMMEQGEKDEKIVRTLTDLGLDKREAEQLLNIGKGAGISAVRSDIAKMAKEQIDLEFPELQKLVVEESMKSQGIIEQKIETRVMNDLRAFKKEVEESLNNANKVISSLEEKLDFSQRRTDELEKEVRKSRLGAVSEKYAWMKLVLIAGGIIFSLSALALVFLSFSSLTMETIILVAIIALTGITMFFGSSMV